MEDRIVLKSHSKLNDQLSSVINTFLLDILQSCDIKHEIPDNIYEHFTLFQKVLPTLKIKHYIQMFQKDFYIPEFKTLDERSDYLRLRCDMIKTVKNKHIWDHYKYIESIPQYEQKSIEWHRQRENFITASAGADSIDESKYKSKSDFLLDKIGLGKPFKENVNVYHGKKLETIATLIYSHINNVFIGEFGLIPHINNISFLGASPDGICTNLTLDGKNSKMVGIMLEIKCVTLRKINISGPEHVFTKEKGDPSIVPHYYWIQIQLQLECCDLEICDFWQAKIKDYWSERLLFEARKDKKSIHTIEQGVVREIDENLEYGVFIELLPVDVSKIPSDEKKEWYAKFIYPPRLDIDFEKKKEWAYYMKENWKTHYPQYAKDYYFGKILYFNTEQTHCYRVHRNREWFEEKLPLFKEFWDSVLYYRNNSDAKKELIKKITNKLMESDDD